MPTAALRPCLTPGCPGLVRRGRCAQHGGEPRPWQHARPSRHARGYGSEWDRFRRAVLREEGACRYCGTPLLDHEGKPVRGATVDHITPKAQGGTEDRANLAACCARCQARKASREGNDRPGYMQTVRGAGPGPSHSRTEPKPQNESGRA